MRLLRCLLLPFLILGLLVSQQSAAASSPWPTQPSLETTSLQDGIILDWIIPQVQLAQDASRKSHIEIEGFFQAARSRVINPQQVYPARPAPAPGPDIHPAFSTDEMVAAIEVDFTGSFQVPGFETFNETLLRHPTGGVVAAWGSTGLGVSTGHHWLAEGFLADTFSIPGSNLGSVALAGKLHLAALGFYPDLNDTFRLIGDPATWVFSSHSALLPLIQR